MSTPTIKAGNRIVILIAPPSRHESGHIYRLNRCDCSALKDLRPPDDFRSAAHWRTPGRAPH